MPALVGKYKKSFAFVSINQYSMVFGLLVQYKFGTRNNHCATIVKKLDNSSTSHLCYTKHGIDSWNQMKPNNWQNWA